MLILTRRPDESIIINDGEIVVTVLAVRGNQVRIGIKADESIPIVREELLDRQETETHMKNGNV